MEFKDIYFFIDDSYIGIYDSKGFVYDEKNEKDKKPIKPINFIKFIIKNINEKENEIKNLLNIVKEENKECYISIFTNSKYLFIKNREDTLLEKFTPIKDKLLIKRFLHKKIKPNSFLIVDSYSFSKDMGILFKYLNGFKLKAVCDFSLFNSFVLKDKKALFINISAKYMSIIYLNHRVQKRVLDIGMDNFINQLGKSKEYFDNFNKKFKDKELYDEIKKCNYKLGNEKELYQKVLNFTKELIENIKITMKLFNYTEELKDVDKFIIAGEIEEYEFLKYFLQDKIDGVEKNEFKIDTFKNEKKLNNSIEILKFMNKNEYRNILNQLEIKEKEIYKELFFKDKDNYFFLYKGEFKRDDTLSYLQKKKYQTILGSNNDKYQVIEESEVKVQKQKKSKKVNKLYFILVPFILIVPMSIFLFKDTVITAFENYLSYIWISDSKIDRVISDFNTVYNKSYNELLNDKNATNTIKLSTKLSSIAKSKPTDIWLDSIEVKDKKIVLIGELAKNKLKIDNSYLSKISIFMDKLKENLSVKTITFKGSSTKSKYIIFTLEIEFEG